jgi:hypothetical protein
MNEIPAKIIPAGIENIVMPIEMAAKPLICRMVASNLLQSEKFRD